MRSNLVSLSLVLLLGGCGDDSGGNGGDGGGGGGDGARADAGIDAIPNPCVDNGGADCFELPEMPITVAGVSDGGTEIAANLNCQPPQTTTSEGSLTRSGTTIEATTGAAVPNVPVAIYYDLFGTSVVEATSNSSGAISVTLPGPVPSYVNGRLTRNDFNTYAFNVPLDVSVPTQSGLTFPSAGRDAIELVAAIVGEDWDTTKGIFAATVADCDGAFLGHVVGTLSSTSSTGSNDAPTFVPGAAVYYFGSGTIPLPQPRTEATETSGSSGGFVITRIPPTSASQRYYLQVWGFPDADAVAMGMSGLELVSELPVVIFADSVHGGFLEPTEGP
jgi:hypothetical protein